ncbi:MAG: Smr/MutS family protein [Pyrinomonadaceae bacterium]
MQNNKEDLFNPFPEPVELEITDRLDLHAFAPRDVKSVVENYLREARAKGFSIVRIIHGKGIGVQRETVRKVLAETDFVESFKDAPAFSGHWGATIAHLKQKAEVRS